MSEQTALSGCDGDSGVADPTLDSSEGVELSAAAFDDAEAVIERGQKTFLEVGRALLDIKERGLTELRNRGFQNFEDYLQRRWGWTRDYGQKLLAATRAVKNIERNVDHGLPLPANERQARELARLSAEDQCRVWKRAVQESASGQPTAADIRKIATEMNPVQPASPSNSRSSKSNGEGCLAADAPGEGSTASPNPYAPRMDLVRHLWEGLCDAGYKDTDFTGETPRRAEVQQAAEALVEKEGPAAGALLYAWSQACSDATYRWAATGAAAGGA